MKALVFHGMRDVRVDNVDDPKIEHHQDAIIRITSTAICGSDLHIYNGHFPQPRPMTLGHEFMGIVEELGTGVTNLKVGDRVVVPFPIGCGHCFFCDQELPGHCEHSNEKNYGPEGGIMTQKGGAMFGYTDLYGGVDGGQAEFARVPFAHFGPRKVADGMTDEQVLFLTDIFPTGYTAIDWAQLEGGETVAVFGCGPVGIMAQKVAWLKGAKRVIGIDACDYRLELAKQTANSETININDGDVVEKIRAMTHGRGADVCVEAVGLEPQRSLADRASAVIHLEKGSINALRMCLSAVRRGGKVTVVGVYGHNYDNFPWSQIFEKGLMIRAGQAPVHHYIDKLMAMVEQGKIKLDDIITHRLPLTEAPHAYDIFNKKQDNCLKVVLKPWG